jgi:guanylate kinase
LVTGSIVPMIERSHMSGDKKGRLVILAGPSCVGKSPLRAALARLYPEVWGRLHKLVLINSRAPRPGERDGVDFHFRARNQVEALQSTGRHAVLDVRGDLQALDVEALTALLERGDVFFEGNPFVGRLLQTHPLLVGVDCLSIFLSPLSKEEIVYLQDPARQVSLPELVTDVMRRKLLRRTRRHKGELSLADLENIETRARSAYAELTEAWHFQHVIPNHDGEDSDNWDAFYYPIGDARRSLQTVVALLEGVMAHGVETWDPALVPALHRS